MTKRLSTSVLSLALLLPAAVSLSALSSAALAQPVAAEVQSFTMETDGPVAAGTRLRFRLEGTPRVKASVRLRGVREPVLLREVRPGLYVGAYTLKRSDQVAPDSDVRAMLRSGNRTVVADYELRQLVGVAPAPAAPPQPVARPVDPVRIERFGMLPVDRLEPGVDLQFAVEGAPGANVSVDLPGIERDLRLRETRPGHYEGNYTLRRSDELQPNRPATATLRLGDRVATASMSLLAGRAPAVDNRGGSGPDLRPPSLVQLVPADGTIVPGGGPVQIAAAFDDARGSGVDPASVRISVAGRNVTQEAQINPGGFSLRAALPPGRHVVEVVARDQAGNAVRRSWSFDVAIPVAAAPVNVPLRVLNFRNNDGVQAGPTLVQGHTAPGATVEIRVTASAPAGLPVNVSQELFSRAIQADPGGNFSFSFTPQFPIPGARYEISMVSTRGNFRDEERLVLIQR